MCIRDSANTDDGSCEYAEDNYDCDGNCIVDTDCFGECGGDAVIDECGECDGDGASEECWDGSLVCDASDCPDEPGNWDGDACTMPDHSLHLTSDGSVLYNSSDAIGGFQFDVDGTTVSGGSGGDSGAAGFVVSVGGSTVLGFSFTGASFGPGCGTMVELALNGDATGLSGIVMSSPSGNAIDFEYYEGGGLSLIHI